MSNEKRDIKQEFKDLWTENKGKIKVGVTCLAVGLGIGFIKGVLTSNELHSRNMNELIDRLPPNELDIKDYIRLHLDEFEPFIKEETKYSHDYLEES